MQIRHILLTCITVTAVFEVTACSQSKQDDSAANPGQNSSGTTNVTADQNGAQTQNGQVLVQPVPANGQYPGNTTTIDTSTASGYGDDHQVNVNAPLTDVNVNRDTGSVHVNVPFVHINKEGRGQGTHIDIGGSRGDSY